MHAIIRIYDGGQLISVSEVPIGADRRTQLAQKRAVTARDGATGIMTGWRFAWTYDPPQAADAVDPQASD